MSTPADNLALAATLFRQAQEFILRGLELVPLDYLSALPDSLAEASFVAVLDEAITNLEQAREELSG